MNARPYLSACLLAAAMIAGLAGAMVTEGWANWFFMVAARINPGVSGALGGKRSL
jgi:hypothetical protein